MHCARGVKRKKGKKNEANAKSRGRKLNSEKKEDNRRRTGDMDHYDRVGGKGRQEGKDSVR